MVSFREQARSVGDDMSRFVNVMRRQGARKAAEKAAFARRDALPRGRLVSGLTLKRSLLRSTRENLFRK